MTKSSTIQVVIVKVDGSAQFADIGYDLDSLRAAIGGGWLEAFSANTDLVPWRWTGYCDEEGKLRGLPRNFAADAVAASMGWMGAAEGDFLVGDVVFLGPPDDAGDDTSAPPAMVRYIASYMPLRGFTPEADDNAR